MKFFPKRKKDTHKGNYGSVFIVAGSLFYSGAAVLCANAAIKSGAGLVYLGVPLSIYNVVTSRVLPEIIVVPFSCFKDGIFSVKSVAEIEKFLRERKITSVVFGPGLTPSQSIKKILQKVISVSDCPLIIDADGINVLEHSVKLRGNTVITPHPGEAARILNISVDEIQKNRVKYAKKISEKFGVLCVLKGNKTVVTDGGRVYINSTGNPGMATAGSGDVLSGMLGAIVNQISPLYDAVVAAVYLHGLSGDIAAKENTEVCLTSSDIIKNIPKAIKSIGS